MAEVTASPKKLTKTKTKNNSKETDESQKKPNEVKVFTLQRKKIKEKVKKEKEKVKEEEEKVKEEEEKVKEEKEKVKEAKKEQMNENEKKQILELFEYEDIELEEDQNDDPDVFMAEKMPSYAKTYILPRRMRRTSEVMADAERRKSMVDPDFQMSMFNFHLCSPKNSVTL